MEMVVPCLLPSVNFMYHHYTTFIGFAGLNNEKEWAGIIGGSFLYFSHALIKTAI